MAQLLVRKLPDELVKALKQGAARHNRSAELQSWLDRLTVAYADAILPFDQETVQIGEDCARLILRTL